MTITLYQTADEFNRLNKTLTNQIQMTGTLREECEILNPSFKIQSSQNLSGYNYCYVAEFSRYYKITAIKIIRNNLWEISCAVDVLMSYADQIKALPIIVNRNTNSFNMYLHDNQQVVYENARVQTKLFPTGFSTPTYILTTAGGQGGN